ncbi:MAG: hypothetical protein P8Y13_16935 [Deinococcales bacterium]
MRLVDPWLLAGLAVLAMLLAGALAPLEALGWWAGWFGRRPEEQPVPVSPRSSAPPRHFVVFPTRSPTER